MNDITLAAFMELLLRQSAAGLFVAFIFALLKGWIVIGEQHDDEIKLMEARYEALVAEKNRQIADLTTSRDRWERIALKALNVADQTVTLVEARKEAQL